MSDMANAHPLTKAMIKPATTAHDEPAQQKKAANTTQHDDHGSVAGAVQQPPPARQTPSGAPPPPSRAPFSAEVQAEIKKLLKNQDTVYTKVDVEDRTRHGRQKTSYCGVIVAAEKTHEPRAPSIAQVEAGFFKCSRCGSGHPQVAALRAHFIKCVKAYGNPNRLEWDGHDSCFMENVAKYNCQKRAEDGEYFVEHPQEESDG